LLYFVTRKFNGMRFRALHCEESIHHQKSMLKFHSLLHTDGFLLFSLVPTNVLGFGRSIFVKTFDYLSTVRLETLIRQDIL
jgi:hypothetical protein